MWIEVFASRFRAPLRTEAAGLARELRVVAEREGLLHARFGSGDRADVQVKRAGDTLLVECTCATFGDEWVCAHLWAALRYASVRDLFTGPPALESLMTLEEALGTPLIDQFFDDPEPADALGAPRARLAPPGRTPSPERPQWLDTVAAAGALIRTTRRPPPGAEVLYVVGPSWSRSGRVTVEVMLRTWSKGGRARLQPWTLPVSAAAALPSADDREILALLGAADASAAWRDDPSLPRQVTVSGAAAALLIARMAATGRLCLGASVAGAAPAPCPWRAGEPYRLRLRVRPSADGRTLSVQAELERDGEARPVRDARVLLPGVACFDDHAAPADLPPAHRHWLEVLGARGGELRVPAAEGDALIDAVRAVPDAPPLALPPSLALEERRVAPQPVLRLSAPPPGDRAERVLGQLLFAYDGRLVSADDRRPQLRPDQAGSRVVLPRDHAAESAARTRLAEAGLRVERGSEGARWTLAPRRLGEALRVLAADGWHLEWGAQRVRAAGSFAIEVVSGVDWFDLEAHVDYGGQRVSLPALLRARREGFVRLDDGTVGLLPEEWLARHRLAGLVGTVEGDALRFRRAQVGLLDALLAAMPEARGDAELERARAALARFQGVRAEEAPAGFAGSLRGYQREGLGWLRFLREFGFGGCLADDMGLGKTVQVLALLAGRRATGKPSLVVVPKSLMFNWRREAAHFAPELRVLEHHGSLRSLGKLDGHDLIVTTYGTLVRDIAALRELALDYAILDEAQAIKNPRTEAARAVRLLRAAHRLVLTGTPVENRLSDLWSLFEFLNPGMLGAQGVLKELGGHERADEAARALLGRALRPFILRRTKEQVADDLPPKTEQVIYCELEGDERRRYDELRDYYRARLLGIVEEQGIERSQMHILEALLRLRQAACHPGLLDRELAGAASAKLSTLLDQLDEVVEGGHKALVFSQFTSLLAIVKRQLDERGVAYQYLDGRTRDRQARVDHFQADADCPVFLISLKAGGVGLNLTAAEYVFLLDPWWNPAVEAQAIDRSHRIGQRRAVFAYRLIGRDTIEEKVLALQAQKRHLADAILSADNSLLASIGREELELLLS